MIEYYGWLKIIQNLGEKEDEISETLIEKIKFRLQKIISSSRSTELKAINGYYFLHFTGSANHLGVDFEDIYYICEFIAKEATGTYGIIYLKDDELPEPMDNQFHVYKIARGEIHILEDIYLSPCRYIIED